MKALRTLVLVFGSVVVIGFLVTSVVWWFLSANQTVNDWHVTTTEWTETEYFVRCWYQDYYADTVWAVHSRPYRVAEHRARYWADTVRVQKFGNDDNWGYYGNREAAEVVAAALNRRDAMNAGGGR